MGMPLQPMLIAPFQTGLDTDAEAWIAPPDSFTEADNVHVFDGYIEKREGFRLFGQMKTTDVTVPITGITQAANGVVSTGAPHLLATGDKVYIAGVTGMTQVNNTLFTITILTGTTFQLNVNTTTYGAYVAAGTMAKVINSTDRVMGIYRYINADGSKATLAFNTTRANLYDGASDQFIPLDSAAIMSGSSTDYVWSTNWQSTSVVNRLYFTNGKAWNGAALDGIRYYDATASSTTGFRPVLGGTRTLYGGKLLFSIKERLVVLNTYENDSGTGNTINFPQRARWCQAQGPSNWNDLTPGGGGFVDAPTGDQIISARSLQDAIIVFFTQSVWTLRPVSDPALPFRWDKINDFRACDGKMASIGYDRYIIALGVRGITATDGVETKRIDDRIHDFVTDQINVDEFDKVFCERSYSNRRWWTLYAGVEANENDSALILDDDSAAYTTYSINMNCLGYGNFSEDFGLNDFTAANNLDFAIEDMAEETILSYFWQDNSETLLGGDIHGSVYVLEMDGGDNGVAIIATLHTAEWNPYKEAGVEALLSYLDLYVDTDQQTLATIQFFKDDETSPYATQAFDFLPNLGFIAEIQLTAQTNPCQILIPNHGLVAGNQIYIYGVNGMNAINGGPYVVTVVDDDNITIPVNATGFGAYTFGGSANQRAFYKTKVWKRAYAGGIGYGHRVRFTSTGVDRPFRISAFKPYFKPRGKRTVE